MVASDPSLNGWRLSRYCVRQARLRLLKNGDLDAAEQLLRHSIAYGHNSLTVQRYLVGRDLGLRNIGLYDAYFKKARKEISEDGLKKAKNAADEIVRRVRNVLHAARAPLSRG